MIAIHKHLQDKISEWKSGKGVCIPRLGHQHREMQWEPGNPNSRRIDDSKIFHNRQEAALEWCFFLIEEFLNRDYGPRLYGENADVAYSDFALFADEMEETRMQEIMGGKLSPEELTGAESLAWKALLVGWDRAVSGHPELNCVQVTREVIAP